MVARYFILRAPKTGRLVRMDGKGRPIAVHETPSIFCEHSIDWARRRARVALLQHFEPVEVELCDPPEELPQRTPAGCAVASECQCVALTAECATDSRLVAAAPAAIAKALGSSPVAG